MRNRVLIPMLGTPAQNSSVEKWSPQNIWLEKSLGIPSVWVRQRLLETQVSPQRAHTQTPPGSSVGMVVWGFQKHTGRNRAL